MITLTNESDAHTPRQAAAGSDDGFTIVEVIVTIVVLSIFIFGFFQGYIVLQSQRVDVARQARASDIAYSNLREVTTRPSQVTQQVCNSNASIMDLTVGNASTEPGLDITPYGYALQSATTVQQQLGTSATQALVAYAPDGCANLTTNPLEIVSTVTYGSNGNKVTHAIYVQ